MLTLLRFHLAMAMLAVGCSLGLSSSSSPAPTYRAILAGISQDGNTDAAAGTVVVFVGENGVVGYGGFLKNLEPDLTPSLCEGSPANGCGVHIHAGTSCASMEEQGGHYFDTTEDPWTMERYASESNGNAVFQGVIDIGTDDVEGRAFLVHSFNGARVACGLLERVDDAELLTTTTEPIASASLPDVHSDATALALEDASQLCVFGKAINLEPNLISFQMDSTSPHCTQANGCGVHIHSGFDCSNSTVQGGHFYEASNVAEDPWVLAGYLKTDADGSAYFMDCVVTGAEVYQGRVLIVHANDGSRVSCAALDESQSSSSASYMVVSWFLLLPTVIGLTSFLV